MGILNEAFSRATSQQDFYAALEKQGFKIYFRGKQAGVIGKRKYRLSSLGFSIERLQALDMEPKTRAKELNRIVDHRINKNKDKNNEQTI